MSDGELCPEHVWGLYAAITGADGRLLQRFVCARCPAVLDVGPGEPTPGLPDFPT